MTWGEVQVFQGTFSFMVPQELNTLIHLNWVQLQDGPGSLLNDSAQPLYSPYPARTRAPTPLLSARHMKGILEEWELLSKNTVDRVYDTVFQTYQELMKVLPSTFFYFPLVQQCFLDTKNQNKIPGAQVCPGPELCQVGGGGFLEPAVAERCRH